MRSESEKINELRRKIKDTGPLIHSVSNPISINQCANAVLALGARPMMAQHPKEVREITSEAKALLLNLGNITDTRMEAMKISAEEAGKKGIPFIIDAVGVACSRLRRQYINELFSISVPSVIKGNYSEIMALYDASYTSSGVDSEESLSKEKLINIALKLSKEKNTVILASGKEDIITDGERVCSVANGCEMLSKVTGTGCMQGVIAASFLSSGEPFAAAVSAAAVLGICGEKAGTEKGSGSFMVKLMDALSTIEDNDVTQNLKITYEKGDSL